MNKRRAKPKHGLAGSHQKSWLWGRHVVLETLRARTWPVLELLLAEEMPAEAREMAEALASATHVKMTFASRQRLEDLCHTSEHQGYLAKMGAFPYADAESVVAATRASALYVVLDSIHDPHNFGAIIRSAEVFGVDAVFIASRRQTGVTTAVARASAGAAGRVPIARVTDLCDLVERLQAAGVRVAAACQNAGAVLGGHDFRRRTAIVIGNEGAGINDAVLERCDARVRIPQQGRIGSLNAAAAAAILFYEARRQRREA